MDKPGTTATTFTVEFDRNWFPQAKQNIIMTCDNCIFKKIHLGAGPPDDYSMEYCSKGHWEGGPVDEVIDDDVWVNCNDYTQEK